MTVLDATALCFWAFIPSKHLERRSASLSFSRCPCVFTFMTFLSSPNTDGALPLSQRLLELSIY